MFKIKNYSIVKDLNTHKPDPEDDVIEFMNDDKKLYIIPVIFDKEMENILEKDLSKDRLLSFWNDDNSLLDGDFYIVKNGIIDYSILIIYFDNTYHFIYQFHSIVDKLDLDIQKLDIHNLLTLFSKLKEIK